MKEFEKWIKKAEGDLYNVELLLKDGNKLPDVCCFHSQQAAEKYLKAYLVARNVDFPKTHDLKKLVLVCLEFNSNFIDILKVASRLSDFGVSPSYPGFLDDIIEADAKQAYENALTIKEFILKNFFI